MGKNEIDKYKPNAVIKRTIGTGAFLGFAFYLFWYAVAFVNFTPFPAHIYIDESLELLWNMPTWFQFIVTGSIMIVLAIVSAILYYAIAKKLYSIWIGLLYGLILAGIHMFVIHPLFYDELLFVQSFSSTVTIINLHVLFGLSIGYSISFDYTESMIYLKEYAKK